MSDRTATIRFYQARDGRRLACRVWDATSTSTEVVLVHGIVSHGGWYLSSCQYLANQGFGVHFLERRGSGLNPQHAGDVDDWRTWINDVTDYLQRMPEGHQKVLLGISWGGILGSAYARLHGNEIAGLGLIAPGLCSRRAASPLQRLGLQVASRLGLSNMKVDIPLKDPALFTNSPRSQRYVDDDPLKLRKMTIRFAVNNQALLHQAVDHPEEINVPILLMLAGDDPIADNAATKRFVQRTAHPNKRIIEYPGASHTLEFEDDPSEYFQDLAQWCGEVAETIP